MTSDISLFRLETGLLDLLDHRADRLADKSDPPSDEELDAIDLEIKAYTTEHLPKKVDSIAAVVLWKEGRLKALAIEKDRISRAINSESSDLALLKRYIADVIELSPEPRKGPKKLVGSTHTLTLTGNGGVQPLEITDESLVPNEYCQWEGWLTDTAYNWLIDCFGDQGGKLKRVVSNELVREALEQACGGCDGKGFVNPDGSAVNAFEGSDADRFLSCPQCDGTGRAGVPGARLVERGRHVTVR